MARRTRRALWRLPLWRIHRGYRFAQFRHHRRFFHGGYYPYYTPYYHHRCRIVWLHVRSAPGSPASPLAPCGITAIGECGKRRGRPRGALRKNRSSIKLTVSDPVFELPGMQLDLPRGQLLQPPLLQMIRRPVAEPLLFLTRGFDDGALGRASPVLARRIRDQINEITDSRRPWQAPDS